MRQTAGSIQMKYRYLIINLLAILLFTVGAATAQTELSGSISGTLQTGQYLVTGNCVVESGSELNIDPGTRLIFTEEGIRIDIYGKMTATGSEEAPVYFEGQQRDGEEPVRWGGIRIIESSDTTAFNWCIFRNASVPSNEPPESFGGAVYANRSNVSFNHCFILNCEAERGGAVYLYASTASFLSCQLKWNKALDGAGIYASASTLSLERCLLAINGDSTTTGGGLYAFNSDITSDHCTFADNRAGLGGTVYNYRSGLTLTNCILSDGTGVSENLIYMDNASYGQIEYNDFHVGDGTICFDGGGFHPAMGILLRTNSNGDSCDFLYNLYLDPLFVDPESGLYTLSEGSPCIDVADYGADQDPDGSPSDMGAYWYGYDPMPVREKSNPQVPDNWVILDAYPNPFNNSLTVRLNLFRFESMSIELYNLRGAHVATLFKGRLDPGTHVFPWDAQGIGAGTYFLRVFSYDGLSATRRMILLK